jgi:anti-sigma factor RsiW
MPAEERPVIHPEARELAAYLDGALVDVDRARVEAHLAACAECRGEVAAVAQLLRTAPRRRVTVRPALAAAAVLALLLVPTLQVWNRFDEMAYRESAVTTTAPPVAFAPHGDVTAVRELVWSAVPHAARYRVMLMDGAGTVLWRWETADTVAALADTVRLRAGAPYFWKVEAETGFDRWVASDLVDFTLAAPRP